MRFIDSCIPLCSFSSAFTFSKPKWVYWSCCFCASRTIDEEEKYACAGERRAADLITGLQNDLVAIFAVELGWSERAVVMSAPRGWLKTFEPPPARHNFHFDTETAGMAYVTRSSRSTPDCGERQCDGGQRGSVTDG